MALLLGNGEAAETIAGLVAELHELALSPTSARTSSTVWQTRPMSRESLVAGAKQRTKLAAGHVGPPEEVEARVVVEERG